MPPWERYLARPPLHAEVPYPLDTWHSAASCDSVAQDMGSWQHTIAHPPAPLPSHLSSAFSALSSAPSSHLPSPHLPDRAFSPSLPHHAQGQALPGKSVLPPNAPSAPSAPFTSSAFAFPSLALDTSLSALSLSLRSQSSPDPPARPSLPHAASAGSLRTLASAALSAPHCAPPAPCSAVSDGGTGRRSASMIPYPAGKAMNPASSGSSPSSPASFVSSVSSPVASNATADLSHDSLPADNPWYVSPTPSAPAEGGKDEPGGTAEAAGGKASAGMTKGGEVSPDALSAADRGTAEEQGASGLAQATHAGEVERLQRAVRRAEAAAAEAQQAAAMAQMEMAQMQRACGEQARQVVRLRRELDSAGDAHLQLAAEVACLRGELAGAGDVAVQQAGQAARLRRELEGTQCVVVRQAAEATQLRRMVKAAHAVDLVHLEDFAIAALQHDLKAEARRGLPPADAALMDAPEEYGGCRQFYQTGACHFGRGRRPCPNEASHFCLRCGRAHGTAPHLVLLRRLNARCLLPQ
ncbi:hypothetical protein CLOP_g23964 [Closterium sp. NIES-67]|nr:hypothetical protein CLOP_g23964 [Closterium sp. NIES-67]